MLRFWLFILLISSYLNAAKADDDIKKFVSLKGKITNIRNGPGEEYPVIMTYSGTYMPLAILHRIDDWYMVTDYQDKTGWVKVNLVNGNSKNRNIIFTQDAYIYKVIKDKMVKVAKVEKNMTANLQFCNKKLCKIRMRKWNISGYVQRKSIWGVLENEIL
ncbi:SH3 domain-containing protein [Candidatus Deianiraea vastatrix]|uniref:Bacterial SH3 domain protein n=1 Tax=Candidatus Deianiraea vastatrix TaxID=2163644 RepID=A0A5B8XCM6_9RICK|nr:SH3 domain-containing protein [Candidatus Deianiraea vastatrix]QED23108.1 Bacterial SH3 domain protein [Candidatus Deianiraea vastatrix]